MFDVNQSWGFLLSKIAQEMSESIGKELTNYEITSRDFGILSTVYNESLVTQKDISHLLKIDRTTVFQLIDILENKQLLKRVRHPKDRRSNVIQLTEQGEALLKEKSGQLEICEKNVVSHLSDEEKQAIYDIYQYLQEEAKHE